MTESKTCPECGLALPTGAPEGLCPNCLLRPDLLGSATEGLPQSPVPESERIRYFGDYELEKEIARGGMGVVYLARQVTLNRRVAVKMILAGHLADEATVRRFYAEAEAAARLKHPNIVSIHEVGVHKGQHYFSMDFVDGQNLAELARGEPQPAREAAQIVKSIAEAIHYAHQRGVLHRDLKPSNVLMDAEGRPHVTDFGLAKLVRSETALTHPGDFMGTPSYAAPEQASGRHDQVGPHSDVYALGVILYELLTGRPPFQASSPMETVMQVLEAEPVAPRRRNPDIPLDLETICLKCLEKSPWHRYHSAAELADDLGRFLNQEPVHAQPASFVRKLVAWTRRRPAQLAATVALVVFALVAGVYYLAQENAFLRALQAAPDLARERGARVEAIQTWSSTASLFFFASVFCSLWLTKRMRGELQRRPSNSLCIQPFYPLGFRGRMLAVSIGILATLFSLAYVMRLIEAYVWERGGGFHDIAMAYGTGWFGLWLLVMAAADYRRALYGAPKRRLTSELKDEIDQAILRQESRQAIRLYQQAFSDAGHAEARAYLVQRMDDMRRQNPAEFAAAAPKPWELNWRRMGLSALVQIPIVAVCWLIVQPANPIAIAVGYGIGVAFGLGVGVTGRTVNRSRRILGIAMFSSLTTAGTIAYFATIRGEFGPFMYLGILCGAELIISGFTEKRRR